MAYTVENNEKRRESTVFIFQTFGGDMPLFWCSISEFFCTWYRHEETHYIMVACMDDVDWERLEVWLKQACRFVMSWLIFAKPNSVEESPAVFLLKTPTCVPHIRDSTAHKYLNVRHMRNLGTTVSSFRITTSYKMIVWSLDTLPKGNLHGQSNLLPNKLAWQKYSYFCTNRGG